MKNKPVLLTLLGVFACAFGSGQNPNVGNIFAQWEISPKQSGSSVTLIFKAQIDKNARVFSVLAPDDQPNSRIVFDAKSPVDPSSLKITESGKPIEKKEPLLDNMQVRYFENEVEFFATFSALNKDHDISGHLTYSSMRGDVANTPIDIPFRFSFDNDGNLVAKSTGLQESLGASKELKRDNIDLKNPIIRTGGSGLEEAETQGLIGIFILGLITGFICVITPCVFPMIPLTVSFFTKRTSNKKKGIFHAIFYGASIFFIYIALSIPFHFLSSNNAEILNSISTNIYLNAIFFAIFLFFAFSFFGFYELRLPSRLTNKADSLSAFGGVIGVFFMALTLVLVSFSCTGPVLGSLLAGSLAKGGQSIAYQLTAAMGGFGLALALPFALFAFFPQWLKALPKSGSWLTTVKILLGFIELALALKFLSNVDLTNHLNLLSRKTFILIWLILDFGIFLYLFGFVNISPNGRFSVAVPRNMVEVFRKSSAKTKVMKIARYILILGSVYLFILLFQGYNHPESESLSFASGILPPHTAKPVDSGSRVVNNYNKALALANKEHKPVLIDFTGWACVNCRKMEENVWTAPEVKRILNDKYILVSLYVDDRAELPENEQFVYVLPDSSKKPIRTIGDKFSTFQNVNFSSVSQPLYAIINPNETLLTRPIGYTPNAEEYASWLESGLAAFKEAKGKVASDQPDIDEDLHSVKGRELASKEINRQTTPPHSPRNLLSPEEGIVYCYKP